MKLSNKRVLILLVAFAIVTLLLLGLIGDSAVSGQAASGGAEAARALALEELLASVEGVAKESPRTFKTTDGYLRFVGAPPSTHFAVAPAKRGTAEEAAGAFLEEWRSLFVNVSPAVGFDVHRVNTHDSRSYVRYRQRYAGLTVHGAQMIVQVDAEGGIVAVMSDIMRDTEALDMGKVSLNPTIDALTAQGKAIEWLSKQHDILIFEAIPVTLMIFSPSVVGDTGPAQLVWQTEVGNVGDPVVREFVLVNAHSGEIAFHYPLIYEALHRHIHDYEQSGALVRDEGEPPTEIADVDNAYDYLGATYDFYNTEHGRDSIDDNGMTLIARVRYDYCNAYWTETDMLFGDGLTFDDVVGHEYTHGVTDYTSGLIYSGQSGAINESFSDMWGEWVDQGYTNGNDTDTPAVKWLMGEDVVCTGGAIRDMADPPAKNHPDRLYGPYWDWGGEVHINSGVGNKLCYLLTDGDTFNDHTVTAMGIPKTADLFYECQKNLLTYAADYYDLYYALTQAAINLNLSWAERVNIKEACEAVEICPNTEDWELVGHWNMDDNDDNTTVVDSSENGNNGTFNDAEGNPNTSAHHTNGEIGGALTFDGLDDYVSIPSPSGLIIANERPKSICAWINVQTWTAYTRIFQWYDETNTTVVAVALDADNKIGGTVNGNKKDITNDDMWTPATNSTFETGKWYHVCLTFNGLRTAIYVDGEKQEFTWVNQRWISDGQGVFIGARAGGVSNFFDGVIDDVRVYNYALGIGEIWDLTFYDTSKLFSIKNSSGVRVAWFDNLGNLFLKGTKQDEWKDPDGQVDEFIIEKNSGPTVYIDDFGNLYLQGTLYPDQVPFPSATGADEFRVQNSNGDDVAIIRASNGNVYLKGKLYENPEP